MKRANNELLLPRSEDVEMVEIYDCANLDKSKDVPGVAKNKYASFVEGKACNATLKTRQKKYQISKKTSNSQVAQARVFCNQIQNIRDQKNLRGKTFDEFVKVLGDSKGRFYYENDQYEFRGKDDNSCSVFMDIEHPIGGNHDVIKYNAKDIYVRKRNHKNSD